MYNLITKHYLFNKYIILIISLFLVSIISCKDQKSDNNASKTENSSNTPQLFVDSKLFDFGVVNQGKALEHIFKIKNKGSSQLKISRIQAP